MINQEIKQSILQVIKSAFYRGIKTFFSRQKKQDFFLPFCVAKSIVFDVKNLDFKQIFKMKII